MATELVLLGTAGAPAPVAGRAGISSVLVTGGRVFVVDCGRGTPSGYADAGLDFAQLAGVFITHLHVNHIGDLAGLLLYPWGLRAGPAGPLPPVQVYGPGLRSCRMGMPRSTGGPRSTRNCPPRAPPTWSGTCWPATPTT